MNPRWAVWAPLPLRLMLGFAFLYHGWPKVFTAAGHAAAVGTLASIGVPVPAATAWLVGLVEVLGGFALLIGAFVGIASIILLIEMFVAMVKVHLPNGFNFIHITGMTSAGPTFGMPGYEVNLLYIAGLLALILGGAGALSVDRARLARSMGGS